MERDAHYYAILAFCRACGFNKDSAQVIAYASQFVDDAKINLMFLSNPSNIIEHDVIENKPAFFNMATCHSYFRINTFNYEAMVNNTCAFHFVPGCKGENFTKKLRCKEESPIILDILADVFLEDDLIKLGIILHALADSYTHQGFSGMLSKVNDIKDCKAITKVYLGLLDKILQALEQFNQEKYDKYFDRIMPAYGHGQAREYPDLPDLVWSYEYDYSDEFSGSYKKVEIDNKDRFTRAFKSIRKHIQNYLIKHPQYFDSSLRFDNINILMDTLVSKGKEQKREENWKKLLIKQGLFNNEDLDRIIYKDDQWLKEAFSNFDRDAFDDRTVAGEVQLADNFLNSNWYRFYLSVKWYKLRFFEYCAKYQLSIPN
ncbi:MAG: hypothetical protein APF81_19160 [Desulfosporosinus sp. BRH_c37]|nr:MAG: hypothetical protein APF81_19160 [Desulfosporosinus sp. BRH_c37]